MRLPTLILPSLLLLLPLAQPAGADLSDDASAALRGACGFFTETVACEGGYLWAYDLDHETSRR